MANQYEEIKIKYSPVLKDDIEISGEASFGRKIRILKDSADLSDSDRNIIEKLQANNQYKFLQEAGADFFKAVHEAYYDTQPGEISIEMETTEDVYKEFENMIEWYNKSIDEKRFVLKELINKIPSNEEIFQFIKQSVQELNNEFTSFDVSRVDNDVKDLINQGIENFSKRLQDNEDNAISICITGVFSTGKSTLINALVGANILESDSDPTTTGIFSIKKIKKEDDVKISFDLVFNNTEKRIDFIYKNDTGYFDLSDLPPTDFADSFNSCINDFKGKCDMQLQAIVSLLNKHIKTQNEETEYRIDNEILISYPFDLGGDVPITIYDTPGSNSTYTGDKGKITAALQNQKNSILITVLDPDKKGDKAGNDILFSAINSAENDNQYIDKSRILFVYNKIDGDNSDDDCIKKYKNGVLTFEPERDEDGNEIDDSNNTEIKLSDYHLYFISSKKALAAEQLINGSEDKKVTRTFNDTKIYSDLWKECSCGWETESIHKLGDEALEKAKNAKDKVLVESGLFTLKTGISKYIQKYATAIRAKSLYDVIEDSINDMRIKLEAQEERLNKIQKGQAKDYESEKDGLKKFVKETCENHKNKLGTKLTEYNLKSSSAWLNDINSKIENECRISHNGKILGKYHFKSTNQSIERAIVGNVNRFVSEHTEKAKERLQEVIEQVNQEIGKDLQKKLANVIGEKTFEEIYQAVTNSATKELNIVYYGKGDQFLWLYNESPSSFEQKLRQQINTSTASIREAIDDFTKSMESKINEICNSYLNNLDSLSEKLKEIANDIEKTKNQITAAKELELFVSKTKESIDLKIWERK